MGFEVKKVDILKILKDYDREGNGKITFEDFNEVGMFPALFACVGPCTVCVMAALRACNPVSVYPCACLPMCVCLSDRPYAGEGPKGGDPEGL